LIFVIKIPSDIVHPETGQTLLHVAVSYHHHNIIDYFKKYPLIVVTKDKQGVSSLDLAEQQERDLDDPGNMTLLQEFLFEPLFIEMLAQKPAIIQAVSELKETTSSGGVKVWLELAQREADMETIVSSIVYREDSLKRIEEKTTQISWWNRRDRIDWSGGEMERIYLALFVCADKMDVETFFWVLDQFHIKEFLPSYRYVGNQVQYYLVEL